MWISPFMCMALEQNPISKNYKEKNKTQNNSNNFTIFMECEFFEKNAWLQKKFTWMCCAKKLRKIRFDICVMFGCVL